MESEQERANEDFAKQGGYMIVKCREAVEGEKIELYNTMLSEIIKWSKSEFDYEAFYEWCGGLNIPVYVSEYQMPDEFEIYRNFAIRQLSTSLGATERVNDILWKRKDQELEPYGQMNIFDFI